jgi:flagellar biosynthesis protein FlhA
VRIALGRAIVQQVYQNDVQIAMMGLQPELENVLLQAATVAGNDAPAIEPGLAQTLLTATRRAVEAQERMGLPAALLVPDRLRAPLARFLRRALPQLRVIAVSEVPDNRTVKLQSFVGAPA